MKRAKRIGIFGGTFNPIHHGHLRAAEEVREALDLERVVFVPSAQPPHKHDHAGDPMAPAAERLRWTRTAVAGNAAFEVDVLECPECGGRLRILATIHPPEATRAILECLGLPSRPPPLDPSRLPPPDDFDFVD